MKNRFIIVVVFCLLSQSLFAQTATGYDNGHGYVDLGLSVKWATCNVGAKTPGDYGSYFAWGETTPKSDYSWATLRYCPDPDGEVFTKYNTDSKYGPVDNRTRLELSDDAARASWGGSWRMPTIEEWAELFDEDNCKWTWTTQNGVDGYRVISKINGRYIFLPAAGFRYGAGLNDVGSYGGYWSSTLGTGNPSYAWGVYFISSNIGRGSRDRYFGRSIRPVQN